VIEVVAHRRATSQSEHADPNGVRADSDLEAVVLGVVLTDALIEARRKEIVTAAARCYA
jgi:hypothetical protein